MQHAAFLATSFFHVIDICHIIDIPLRKSNQSVKSFCSHTAVLADGILEGGKPLDYNNNNINHSFITLLIHQQEWK